MISMNCIVCCTRCIYRMYVHPMCCIVCVVSYYVVVQVRLENVKLQNKIQKLESLVKQKVQSVSRLPITQVHCMAIKCDRHPIITPLL